MKYKFILAVILLAGLLISCKQTDSPAQTTVWTMAPFQPQAANPDDWDTMKELHEQWLVSGNPDYFENAVSYELTDPNGEMSYTLQEIYTTQDGTWQVKINGTSNFATQDWTHMPSLEKLENGEWVRQAILWDEQTYHMAPSNYAQRGLEYYRTNPIRSRPLQIPVADIYTKPTAGQYRFVVYVEVVKNDTIEKGMYYIPFEVVE